MNYESLTWLTTLKRWLNPLIYNLGCAVKVDLVEVLIDYYSDRNGISSQRSKKIGSHKYHYTT